MKCQTLISEKNTYFFFLIMSSAEIFTQNVKHYEKPSDMTVFGNEETVIESLFGCL